jgi:hypothetical protein
VDHLATSGLPGETGAIGVSAASPSSRSSGCGVEDSRLPFQELRGRQWVALNLDNSKKC